MARHKSVEGMKENMEKWRAESFFVLCVLSFCPIIDISVFSPLVSVAVVERTDDDERGNERIRGE